MMKGIMKTMLAILCATSLSTFAATDNTPQDAFNDITRSLADLQPITFQAPAEKYKLLVFIDNQCIDDVVSDRCAQRHSRLGN